MGLQLIEGGKANQDARGFVFRCLPPTRRYSVRNGQGKLIGEIDAQDTCKAIRAVALELVAGDDIATQGMLFGCVLEFGTRGYVVMLRNRSGKDLRAFTVRQI